MEPLDVYSRPLLLATLNMHESIELDLGPNGNVTFANLDEVEAWRQVIGSRRRFT